MQITNMKAMWRKPFFVIAGVFPANLDLSWIPDAGFSLPLAEPAETPDGTIDTFTFASAPRFVLWNGVWYSDGYGYTRTGLTVRFVDENGVALFPNTGDFIRAIL